MDKIELKDTAILLLIHLDCLDRVKNLKTICDFINNHFDATVYVTEVDKCNYGVVQSVIPNNFIYNFVQDDDNILYRTKYLNMMARNASEKYIIVWDADVLLDPRQVETMIGILSGGVSKFCLPYDSDLLDVPTDIRDAYVKDNKNFEIIPKYNTLCPALYNHIQKNFIGGIFGCDRMFYLDNGLESEKYYGWGLEDGWRLNTAIQLTKILRVTGNVYHLHHEREAGNSLPLNHANVYKSKIYYNG